MEIMGFEFQSTSGVAGALRVAEIRMKTKLPLPDCYVIDIAIRLRLPLISFDQKLNVRAREIGIETIF
jgi:predicted nucleic acid-binding protein